MTQTLAAEEKARLKKYDPGRDWKAYPEYEAAKQGLQNYWYPVLWAQELKGKPKAVKLCGEKIVLHRDKEGRVRALHNRCPHRGVRLSEGKQWFPDTLSCPYHGWTFNVKTGDLVAVITDGPDSAMCGKAAVKTFPAQERIGLIWVYIGDKPAHSLKDQLPEELVDPPIYAVGGRIEDRDGDWRLYAENGFDEGHAKYLHRTSSWRIMKVMPTWNKIHIEKHGRWLYRVEDERHWEAYYPGLGKWTNERWYKIKPKQRQGKFMGNTGGGKTNPYIKSRDFPGFASLSLPGVLRIAYPQFIHYEFYVPIDINETKYVGVMVRFNTGIRKWLYYLWYLIGIRWMFHGNFSGQDHWMVGETNAPPERLFRPDVSLLEWRRLFKGPHPIQKNSMKRLKNVESTPQKMPEGRMISAGNDEYHVIEKGVGDRVVFFLHGGGPGCTAWSDFAVVSDLFAKHYRCIMPDLLQYGRSSKHMITGPMWDHHSHSMTQLMDSLRIDKADFVCNSWGGTIALRLASRYPERVRSLTITGSMPVFYGPLCPLPENGRRGRNARDRYYGGEGPTFEKMRQLMADLEWYDETKIPEETVRMRYEQSLDKEERALAAKTDNPRGDWQDLTNELADVACPTLFCWGMQDDFLTPDYPLMLSRMVQRGQVHILDAASHHLQEERPEHYFQIVHGFLQQPMDWSYNANS